MSTAVISIEGNPELRTRALTLAEQAKALAIFDQASYDLAADRLRGVADLRREIEAHHAPLKQKAHEAHKAICDAEKRLLEPVSEAERAYKASIGKYQIEQQRIAAERQRIADEEARRLAEEAREREIETAERDGADAVEIQAIAEAPLPVAPRAIAAPAFQPAAGVSTAKVFRGRVSSMAVLVKAAAGGNSAAMSILQVNEVALNGLARSTRGTLQIPGVEFVEDFTVRAGRR